MPPEVWKGEAETSKRIDTRTARICMMEIYTGRPRSIKSSRSFQLTLPSAPLL